MSGEFLGTYENSMNKNRVIIPAPFKKAIKPEAENRVVVTMGYNKSNIAIYPFDVWNSLVDRLSNGNDKQRLQYMLMRDKATVEVLEPNNRIKIPQNLLNLVGITNSVVVKGEGRYISLWNPETLDEIDSKNLEILSTMYSRLDFEV
jgi:MraZ protein